MVFDYSDQSSKELRIGEFMNRDARHQLAMSLFVALFAALACISSPFVAQATELKTMHRLYNPYSGEHLYTADANERATLSRVGWRPEGEAWVAPESSSVPVWRLYNPWVPGGDHHYTTDKNEYDELKKAGWKQEGVGWYSDDEEGIALHRLYNPFATTGTHHYTRDKNERDELVRLGWKSEGVAWYGVDAGSSAGSGGNQYVLRDGVKSYDDYTLNGDTSFTIKPGSDSVAAGDKIVLEGTKANPFGAAGTVTAVKKNSNGTLSVNFRQATDPSEVFYSIESIQKNLNIDPSSIAIEGSRSSNARIAIADSWSPEEGAIGDDFNIKLDNNGSYVKGNFSIKPILSYDVKWTLFGGLERCELTVKGDTDLNAEAHVQNKNANKDIKILEAKVPLAYGFSVDLPIYAHVTAEGSLEVSVSYDMETSVRLDDGKWKTSDKSDFDAEMNAAVHMRLGGKVGAELKLLGVQLIDAAVSAGADGEAKTTARDTGLVCGDLSVYGYLGVEVGTGTDYLVNLGWTYDGQDLINEDNSPLKLKLHFENGSLVDKCTYNNVPGDTEGSDDQDDSGESGTTDDSEKPDEPDDEIDGLRVVQVAAGYNRFAAVTEDGALWVWGYCSSGWFQDNKNTVLERPTKMMDNVKSVVLGWEFSAALKTDGSLWTWGSNSTGQLGYNATPFSRGVPTKMMDDVKQISAGSSHCAAVKTDGTLWLWGNNCYGQIGNGTEEVCGTPVKIMSDVSFVALGSGHSAAVKTDGTLWVWGWGTSGQIGNGLEQNQNVPVKVMDGVASAALGTYHTAAIKNDGSLWVFGLDYGQNLHEEYRSYRLTPEKVMDDVASVELGACVTFAIKNDGTLWAWGENYQGELGNGKKQSNKVPTKIMDDVSTISFEDHHAVAAKKDGSLWAWGDPRDGELGDGVTKSSDTPIKIVIESI